MRRNSFVRPALAIVFALSANPALAATFTVSNNNSSGAGSLAKAITDANATVAADTIQFQLLLGSIGGVLPPITQPVTIDGYSPFAANENTAAIGTNADIVIQLDASSVPTGQAMLQVNAGPTVIQGLSIRGIGDARSGIAVGAGASGVHIRGNFLGVAVDGTTDGSFGTGITDRGTGTVIGGENVAYRNLVSGNDIAGIELLGAATVVSNNLIGSDASGYEEELFNGFGIRVSSATAGDILIGGRTALAANWIQFNDEDGIAVLDSTGGNVAIEGNQMRGNNLGIDLGDDGPTPNDAGDTDDGPNGLQNYPVLSFANHLNDTQLKIEGHLDTQPGTYRIEFFVSGVSGPQGHGAGGSFVGATELVVGDDIRFFRVAVATPWTGEEAHVSATAQNLATGETSEISRALKSVYGGTELVVTNANNSGPGSLRAAIDAANASSNKNTIVFFLPSPEQTIQASSPYILAQPVVIDGYTQPGSHPNTLRHGSDADIRVEIDFSSSVSLSPAFNVAGSATLLRGIAVHGAPAHAIQFTVMNDTILEGSYIGTDRTGTINHGNSGSGVIYGNANASRIGGDIPAQRNIVSGSTGFGIIGSATGVTIQGNLVGTDATGTADFGNGSNGITVEGNSAVIGSEEYDRDTASNVIRFNGGNGIGVASDVTIVKIGVNRISDNDGLGIDVNELDTPQVTPNDIDDADAGRQNFPVLTEVTATPGNLHIEGTLDIPPATQSFYTLQVYANDECDPSGYGEGQIFLWSEVPIVNASETFSFDVPVDVEDGQGITMTAMRSFSGDTSEFSECVLVEVEAGPVCGDASGDESLTASDALLVLKTAVGTRPCIVCVCDVNESSSVTSTDALLVLKASVGQPVVLDCPSCN